MAHCGATLQPCVPFIDLERPGALKYEALLCFSVLQNTTALFEQAFRILRRLRTAYERQKNLVDVLNQHEVELKSVKTIIGIIEDEEELQTEAVATELDRIKNVQTKLRDLLVALDPQKKGKMNQLARQFVQGSTDERKLSNIMSELGTVKQTLLLRIQVAQVGVMRNMQKELVANAEVIRRIDESLREQVSNCEGLRIARLLKDRRPAEDGTVSISAEELAKVTRIETDTGSDDGTLVDESELSPSDLPITNGRDIHHNRATDDSVQINAAVETDLWAKFDRISVRHNHSSGRAVQVNHANPLDVMKFFRSWQKENNAQARQERFESVVRFER